MKQQGRLIEQEEDEYHGADIQNQELHGHFRHGVEQEAEAALANRFPGQIALHLALVGAEIGEREERPADHAAPQVVTILPVEVRHHGVELACRACEACRIEERDTRR